MASALTPDQTRRLNQYLSASGSTGEPLAESSSVQALLDHPSVDATLLGALDVVPAALIFAGATLPQLRQLGYGASQLVRSPTTTASFVRSFGKAEVAASVLDGPESAVILAGTFGAQQLGLSSRLLLNACLGNRHPAMCVIGKLLQDQNLAPSPLGGCVEVIARCGIDARTLGTEFRIPPEALPAVLDAKPEDLQLIGLFWSAPRRLGPARHNARTPAR